MDEGGGSVEPLGQGVVERRDVPSVHQSVVAEDGDGEKGPSFGGVVFSPGDAGVAVGGEGDGLDQPRVGDPGESGDKEET